jgi:hypothetical protein
MPLRDTSLSIDSTLSIVISEAGAMALQADCTARIIVGDSFANRK